MDNFNPNITIVTALAYYVLWGINQGTWSDLFAAMTGKVVISSSRLQATTAPSGSAPSASSSAPTTTPTKTSTKAPVTVPGWEKILKFLSPAS